MAESATSVGSLTFLGLFAMFSLSPRFTRYACDRVLRSCLAAEACSNGPCKLETDAIAPARGAKARSLGSACPLHPQTSYWLGRANEMAPVNTILIIVNSPTP